MDTELVTCGSPTASLPWGEGPEWGEGEGGRARGSCPPMLHGDAQGFSKAISQCFS